jgi:2'-5' RNA ligase
MQSTGHTLWLMPTGEAYEKFSGLIKKLAAENNAPIFEPHVTLLGDFQQSEEECVRLTKQLVSGQKPFSITMKDIDYEEFYFRTLFVRAEKTEPLLALHNRSKEIFKMDIPPFMPHLSLLYGTFPVETKEKIIREIGRNQSIQFEVKSVFLIKGGEITDWQILEEFPLGN